jgi:hypothetical protein
MTITAGSRMRLVVILVDQDGLIEKISRQSTYGSLCEGNH